MLARSKVVLIRHAEDPELDPASVHHAADDPCLALVGLARAHGYVDFLTKLPLLDGHIDFLFAARNSQESQRSVMTLTPLAERLRLPINSDFSASKDAEPPHDTELVKELHGSTKYRGKNIVICWHHRHLLRLARWLLGDQHHDRLWARERWPDDLYGQLLLISYDDAGVPTARSYK
jgi:hypothetical protein